MKADDSDLIISIQFVLVLDKSDKIQAECDEKNLNVIAEFDYFEKRNPTPPNVLLEKEWDLKILLDACHTAIKHVQRYFDCIENNAWQDEPCGHHYQRAYEALGAIPVDKKFTYELSKKASSWMNRLNWDRDDLFRRLLKEEKEYDYGYTESELETFVELFVESYGQIARDSEAVARQMTELLVSAQDYFACRGLPRGDECPEQRSSLRKLLLAYGEVTT